MSRLSVVVAVGLAVTGAGLVGAPDGRRPPPRVWALRLDRSVPRTAGDGGHGAALDPFGGASRRISIPAARSWLRSRWLTWCTGLGRRLIRLWPGGGPVLGDQARSGRPGPTAGTEARLGAAVTAGLAVAPVSPALVLPAVGLAWAWPAWRARSGRARQHRRLVESVPDLVEMFRLAVGSGLSVHLAVRALAPRLGGPGGEALADVVAGEDNGQRLADGLERLGALGEPLRPLAAALVAAERYGAPLGPALDRASAEARELRRRQAEEAARRLPVLMLFPLVMCILPAGALLTVVPLLAASWPRLSG